MYLRTLMLERNGKTAFTLLETSKSAVPAGPLLPQRHSLTEYVLPVMRKSTRFSPQKVWLSATRVTTAAKEENSSMSGSSLKSRVLSQINAIPTCQVKEKCHNAPPNVLTLQFLTNNINAKKVLLLRLLTSNK